MAPYLQKIYDIFLLSRPFNAVQPLILFVFGVIIAGGDIKSVALIVGLIMLFLIHSAVTIWNDINDQKVDALNNVKTVLTRGYVSDRTLRYVVAGLAVVGLLLSILFLPITAFVLAVIIVVLGWQYSAPPLKASHRPIASMVVLGLSYGALPLLIGASLGHITLQVWLFALAWTFARVSLSLLKDYKDAVGDARAKKKTFLLRFGHRRVVATSIICLVVGYGAVTALVVHFVGPSYAVYVIAVGVLCVALLVVERLRLRAASTYQAQHDLFREIGYVQLGIDGGLLVWLILLSIS